MSLLAVRVFAYVGQMLVKAGCFQLHAAPYKESPSNGFLPARWLSMKTELRPMSCRASASRFAVLPTTAADEAAGLTATT
jgi:hypothetical protein